MSRAITLYPLNDLVLKATLKEVVDGSLTATPLTTGTVSAFISETNASTATAFDASLTTTGEYVAASKAWRIAFDADALDPELLAPLVTAGAAFVIIEQSGGFRTAVPVLVADSRPATVG